jgi:hypothetical protein
VAAGWAWSEAKGIQVILDMIGGDYFGKHIELRAARTPDPYRNDEGRQ